MGRKAHTLCFFNFFNYTNISCRAVPELFVQLSQPGSKQKLQGSSFCTAQTDWQGNINVSERIVTQAPLFKAKSTYKSYHEYNCSIIETTILLRGYFQCLCPSAFYFLICLTCKHFTHIHLHFQRLIVCGRFLFVKYKQK